MAYFITLLLWIGEAESLDQARPHCEQVFDMLDAADSRGEHLWKLCHADKSCEKASDAAEDYINECGEDA